ncbi:MAG TPA: XrtA system polysaccharide chain length determinant [Rhodanobacteraceae bacterium]|nr:XrtA system polysaccharide chain length determinant [Rhodanobacteraceae bacterium]
MLTIDEMPPSELVPALYREGRKYGVTLAIIFSVISLAALVVGSLWSKTYTASTTILAQASDIIQPLMEGRAVPTGIKDRAGLARQVVFGGMVMEEILKTGGWAAENPSPIGKDKIVEQIKDHITITSPRPDLIQITYSDSDRKRAFDITERLAALFIQESRATKERESREAFEFIDKQVNEYHKKLTDAEASLQAYRSDHADAQPGSATDANTRIGALRTEIEQSRMALMQQESTEGALSSQLSGEADVTAVQTRASLYRAQLVDLQAQLSRLLLTYTDKYPDVIRVRHQIQDIQTALASEEAQRGEQGGGTKSAFDNAQFNPHYLELKNRLSEARATSTATRSRMDAAEAMLKDELERSRRIAASESALAELTRDYEVNRDIYQDLLKRRENARVSMVMDEEQRGLTMRIQDPAVMPVRPSGLRLMHFALGGLGLALVIPIGLLFARVRFDPRIRSAQQLERLTSCTVLATVPTYTAPSDRLRERARISMAILLVFAALAAYAVMYWIRLRGA